MLPTKKRTLELGLFCVVLCMFSNSAMLAQQDPTSAEAVVRRAFSELEERGIYTSWDEKLLGSLGDEASVQLTKILGGQPLDDKQIQNALTVIQLTFSEVRRDTEKSRQEPRTTMFVLHTLECSTQNETLKRKVEEVRTYVKHQAALAPNPQSGQ